MAMVLTLEGHFFYYEYVFCCGGDNKECAKQMFTEKSPDIDVTYHNAVWKFINKFSEPGTVKDPHGSSRINFSRG